MADDGSDLLVDALFRIRGGTDGVARGIHERDEMLAHIRQGRRAPRTARFEYFRSGLEAFESVARILAAVDAPRPRRMLDFACGCGRITRFFVQAFGPGNVWAADIDRAATDFVGREIGANVFYSCTDPARLALDGGFDLIFVGSLFSHLPRPAFGAWLARLHGALRAGGLLVFSTHGRRDDRAGAFEFTTESETARLPGEEYGSSFATPEAVEEIAAAVGVEPVAVLPREIWASQDLYVAGRDRPVDLSRVPRKIYGNITRVDEHEPGRLLVTGEVHWGLDQHPPRDVRMFVDGQEAAGVEFGEPRRGPFPGWRSRDWWVAGSPGDLPAGEHSIVAVAEHGGGERMVCDARLFSLGGSAGA